MKKILIIVGALILLSIVFYLGFVMGSGTEQEPQAAEFEYVENDSNINKTSSQDLHELKAVPDVTILAKLMIDEKKTNRLNDAPYMAYIVDSLGFALEPGNDEEWWRTGVKEFIGWGAFEGFQGGGIHLFLESSNNGGKPLRRIRIETGDSELLWYLFLSLKEFGIQGPDNIAEGKGLAARAEADCLWMSYEKTDLFPKKQ